MMKETNIHSQVTSTIAGDDGEAMAKSEGYVAENGFVATDPTHFGKTRIMINSFSQQCQPKGVIKVNQGGVGQPSFQHPDTDTPLE